MGMTNFKKNNIGTMPSCKYPAAMRAVTCLRVWVLMGILPWNVRESVNTFTEIVRLFIDRRGLSLTTELIVAQVIGFSPLL